MNNLTTSTLSFILIIACCLVWTSCSSTQQLSKEGFTESETDKASIIQQLPDYSTKLHSLKGKGRAIVSEPNNTERVTLLFSSNRQKSLVTIRNRLGIEGGKLLTDGDTLLAYNKIDKYARKISIRDGELERINRLASLNILDIINYTVDSTDISQVLENQKHFKLLSTRKAEIFVDKESNRIREVVQPKNSDLPYSKIVYDAYSELNGFILPRRITIFGAEGSSKIALQLTSLELNPDIGALKIDLPDDTRIYHR